MSLRNWKILSIGYLLIPNLIFVANWLKIEIALPCFLMMIVLGWQVIRNIETDNKTITLTQVAVVALVSVFLCYLFGIGEFRKQELDFEANNIKLYDLINRPWPLYFDSHNRYLAYYIGYYLPTALIAKAIGIAAAKYLLMVWTSLGVALIFGWIILLSNKYIWWTLLICILFADTWFMFPLWRWLGNDSAYIASNFLNINGYWLCTDAPLIQHLGWAPQHTIPAGLVVFITWSCIQNINASSVLLAVFALLCSMIWSPFASIGSFVFTAFVFAYFIIRMPYSIQFWLILLSIVLSFVPIMLYLLSNDSAGTIDFLWQVDAAGTGLYVFVFVLCQFLIWVPLIQFQPMTTTSLMILMAILALCLLVFFRMGLCNDLFSKASIPLMYALGFGIASTIVKLWNKKNVTFWAFGLILCLNSLSPIRYIVDRFQFSKPFTTIETPFVRGATDTLSFLSVTYCKGCELEYTMNENSVFYRYILKKHKQ
jgi:hypothetical protein